MKKIAYSKVVVMPMTRHDYLMKTIGYVGDLTNIDGYQVAYPLGNNNFIVKWFTQEEYAKYICKTPESNGHKD